MTFFSVKYNHDTTTFNLLWYAKACTMIPHFVSFFAHIVILYTILLYDFWQISKKNRNELITTLKMELYEIKFRSSLHFHELLSCYPQRSRPLGHFNINRKTLHNKTRIVDLFCSRRSGIWRRVDKLIAFPLHLGSLTSGQLLFVNYCWLHHAPTFCCVIV